MIFINDLPVDLDLTTSASLFADDTATWRRDGKIKGSDKVMTQTEVDKILNWADRWKMKVNGSKTKAMVISSSKKDREWDPELIAGEDKIERVDDYLLLGVGVASDLLFKEHVAKKVEVGKKRIQVLKCMAAKDWGFSLERQKTIYMQFARPAMEYASPSWTPWVSDTQLLKLQRVQNQALRSIAGLAITCPIDFLHLETGIEPFVDRFDKNNKLMRERYLRLPQDDPRRELMEKKATVKLKTRQGLRHATNKYAEEASFDRDVTRPMYPPWRQTTLIFDKVKLEKKEEYSKEELKRMTEEKIEGLWSEIVMYTDGSTNDNQENGGAGLYVTRIHGEDVKLCWPAGRYCSSYGAEAVAFLRAIEWAEEHCEKSITICTDSLSLHQALEKDDWRDADDWIGKIKEAVYRLEGEVTVLWIPSHCGTLGNEVVDALANDGAKLPQGGIPVTHAIAKARIRKTKWKISHPRAAEMYGDRRSPKMEIESKWSRKVRTLFANLRTDHAKELKQYRYKIDAEDDPYCECKESEENIKHVLCSCPRLMEVRTQVQAELDAEAEKRRRQRAETEAGTEAEECAEEQLNITHIISDPERCRKMLAVRFPDLETHTTVAEEAQNMVVGDPGVTPREDTGSATSTRC